MTINGFWQQGEVQSGRVSARRNALEPDYAQTCLVPPDVLEIRLRLGFIRADHHARWQLEVIDPGSRELLAMHSCPHFSPALLEEELSGVGARLGMLIESFLDPDPFP